MFNFIVLSIFSLFIFMIVWFLGTILTGHYLNKMGNWFNCSCGYRTRNEGDFLEHLRNVDCNHWQLGTYVFHCQTCGYGVDYFEDAYAHVVRNPLHEMYNDGVKA